MNKKNLFFTIVTIILQFLIISIWLAKYCLFIPNGLFSCGPLLPLRVMDIALTIDFTYHPAVWLLLPLIELALIVIFLLGKTSKHSDPRETTNAK